MVLLRALFKKCKQGDEGSYYLPYCQTNLIIVLTSLTQQLTPWADTSLHLLLLKSSIDNPMISGKL